MSEPLPSYGDLMTLDEFCDMAKDGYLIDYDGVGEYVRDNRLSGIEIVPSDVTRGDVDRTFTHVVWFNR